MDRSVVLSAKVTSRLVTALINVTETDIFCRRYFKINNSTVMNIFKRIFAVLSKIYLESVVHIILLGCVQI